MPATPGTCSSCGATVVSGTVALDAPTLAALESITVQALPSAQRSILTTSLTGGADRTVPAGRRSVTLVVLSGTTVTFDGVTVPAGTYTYEADGANTLPSIQINTTSPDTAVVMELF